MSRLPFELFLALRYLRPKRTFVSVITLISIVGVMLGVAVLIIVISVMTGFDRQLREKILGFSADVTVLHGDGPMADFEAVMAKVKSHPRVKAAAPFVLGQVLIKTQPDPPGSSKPMIGAPYVRGVDPAVEGAVSALETNLIRGEFNLEGNGILVGSELAYDLRLRVGDRLAIYSPRNIAEMEEQRGKGQEVAVLPDDYVVRGVFNVGYYEYNKSVVVTSLDNAQDLYQLAGKVHGLFVKLDDPYFAPQARAELHALLGRDFDFKIWTEENSQILTALAVEKNVMFYLLIFIVIVAAFGIMNSLITFVVQKTREIGTLKALGAAPGQIVALFLGQSFIVGMVGVAAGFGLGMLALEFRNEFLAFMNRMTGLELFPAAIYNFTELPAVIDPGDIIFICGSALVICLLAGALPAWKAGRLRPVEALRHE